MGDNFCVRGSYVIKTQKKLIFLYFPNAESFLFQRCSSIFVWKPDSTCKMKVLGCWAGHKIWGNNLRPAEAFLHGNYATCLVLPPISGDHQYVSAQVGPVEAFHIGCCPLTAQPVELRLFQISLFFLYRCHELTTP